MACPQQELAFRAVLLETPRQSSARHPTRVRQALVFLWMGLTLVLPRLTSMGVKGLFVKKLVSASNSVGVDRALGGKPLFGKEAASQLKCRFAAPRSPAPQQDDLGKLLVLEMRGASCVCGLAISRRRQHMGQPRLVP